MSLMKRFGILAFLATFSLSSPLCSSSDSEEVVQRIVTQVTQDKDLQKETIEKIRQSVRDQLVDWQVIQGSDDFAAFQGSAMNVMGPAFETVQSDLPKPLTVEVFQHFEYYLTLFDHMDHARGRNIFPTPYPNEDYRWVFIRDLLLAITFRTVIQQTPDELEDLFTELENEEISAKLKNYIHNVNSLSLRRVFQKNRRNGLNKNVWKEIGDDHLMHAFYKKFVQWVRLHPLRSEESLTDGIKKEFFTFLMEAFEFKNPLIKYGAGILENQRGIVHLEKNELSFPFLMEVIKRYDTPEKLRNRITIVARASNKNLELQKDADKSKDQVWMRRIVRDLFYSGIDFENKIDADLINDHPSLFCDEVHRLFVSTKKNRSVYVRQLKSTLRIDREKILESQTNINVFVYGVMALFGADFPQEESESMIDKIISFDPQKLNYFMTDVDEFFVGRKVELMSESDVKVRFLALVDKIQNEKICLGWVKGKKPEIL